MDDDDIAWWKNAAENIPEENIIYVGEEAWEWLNRALDEEPQPAPGLVELLKRANNPPWENR